MSVILSALAGVRRLEERSAIETVIENGDKATLKALCLNPHLTADDLLAIKPKAALAKVLIASHKNCPKSLLDEFLSDPKESVRVAALCNPNSSVDNFRNAVIDGAFTVNGKPFSQASLRKFVEASCHINESFECFVFLWDKSSATVRKTMFSIIERSVDYSLWLNREVIKLDDRFVNFMSSRIASESKMVRVVYAKSHHLSDPVVLDSMKFSNELAILNALAGNYSVWPSTHDYLVSRYFDAYVYERIAYVTSDNDLLNKIYHSTDNTEVRQRVVWNPAFVDLTVAE